MTVAPSVLLSCHIPKTGGTSFRRMFESKYNDRLVLLNRMPQAQPIRRELYPLLGKHYWFARAIDSHDLRYVPPEQFWPGAKFSIILRDPVERFLSMYFFRRYYAGATLRSNDDSETEKWLDANFPSLELFLEQFSAYQTRFVAWASFFKPATAAHLETALRNLEAYDYIGFSECADDFPAVVAADFPELKGSAFPRENVTPKADQRSWGDRVSSDVLRRVREQHEFDRRLYEAAISINRRRGHPVPS